MRVRGLLAFLLLTGVLGATPGRAAPVKFTDVHFEVSDHVLIDSDVYMPPAWDGVTKVPCLVEHTPYRKENRAAEGASFLPDQGFGLIELDARGSASSQGEYDIVFSLREQQDVAEIIEQVATVGIPGVGAACLDKVGMYGGSYSGIIQYLVASLPVPPPHLAAIAPARAYGDLYRDIVYHGGMVIGSFGQIWSAGTTAYYTEPPLDLPSDAAVKAWTDHLTKNDPIMAAYLSAPYSDASFTADDGSFTQKLYDDSSILPRIGNLRVPTLHLAGWFDAFTRGQVLTFEKALQQEGDGSGRGPNYLVAGPWNHSNTHFITPDNGLRPMLAEWYHHWLDGGPAPAFMSGPRVQYYMMKGSLLDTTGTWETASTWPIPEVQYTNLYLRSGGVLAATAPSAAEAGDMYAYNPLAGTAELLSRWDNAASGSVPQPQWDQRLDEPKGLSYTLPLTQDMRIAGTMNLHLHATTTELPEVPLESPDPGALQLIPPYTDTDFVVKISDVAPDGTAILITQGYLRASHRALDVANSEFGPGGVVVRAQHFDDSAHIDPVVQDADTTYDIEIWPTAKTFAAGHSIRLDIYSADTPNHFTLVKPALNTVLHSLGSESFLTVPLLPAPDGR